MLLFTFVCVEVCVALRRLLFGVRGGYPLLLGETYFAPLGPYGASLRTLEFRGNWGIVILVVYFG